MSGPGAPLSSFGDFVGLTLVWYQPVFWMMFYHYKSFKGVSASQLNVILPYQSIIAIFLMVGEFISPIRSFFLYLFNSHALLVTYCVLGTAFTWFLMKRKGWNYPQAISIAFLAVFIGSFYWEIPYLVRNAFITGFEWDWLLHILFVFPIWYINKTIGWGGISKTKMLTLIITGLIISILFMLNNPIEHGSTETIIWDSWYYLLNRVIGTTLIFSLMNKDTVPYPTEAST